jgi:putative thioredoxin
MLNVTMENFELEVIADSSNQPVLVDFWAPWCGPCKVIGPLLEKLELAYDGRFKLVKIDSDQEQQLSAAFGIRSIPTCILLIDGKPVDGFQGALPEGQIKAFLDKNLPPAAEPEEELALEPDTPADPQAQLESLQHAVATDPANDETRFDYIKLLLQRGQAAEARTAFAPVANKTALVRKLYALERWLNAIDFVAAPAALISSTADFDIKIAANKRDFEARHNKARFFISQQRWTDAMDELLEILMRDKTWSEDLARKTYVAVLDLIEPPKAKVADGQIPPDDPVVATYRRRLSSVVLS